MYKKLRQKFKYLKNKKISNKHFSSILKGSFQLQKIVSDPIVRL